MTVPDPGATGWQGPGLDYDGAISLMSARRFFSLAVVLWGTCFAQTPEVGSGAPNEIIRQQFYAAYLRNAFNLLVALPPVGNVRTYGSTGLIQEFQDAAKTSNTRLALLKPNRSTALPPSDDPSTPGYDVFQVYAAMYAYYQTIGVSTAGYPTMDTATCPALTANTCRYQFFDRSYVLFTYTEATIDGQNFYVRDPFFTKWNALGGIADLGGAVTPEQTVTSKPGASARMQTYQRGVIFSITSGTLNGRVLGVKQPVYDLWVQYGGQADFLGLPSSEELTLPDGRKRQSFEGGAIEYASGGAAVLRRPVSAVSIIPNTLRLNLGETATLVASVLATDGAEVLDRVVSWTTSNGRVITVQPLGTGLTATLKATGGGSAVITATSEGKTSPPMAVSVAAPCCQVGEGSPNAAVQQVFQDAVTRNQLALQVPAPGPVRRLGNGYVQDLQGAGNGARYLLAKSDRSPTAYFVTGEILKRYEDLGGPSGSLGYPAADPTPGGRQTFENSSALAGSPVRLVTGPILSKWAPLGYETGSAGPPVADVAAFLTFTGTAGQAQSFRDGDILAGQTGSQAGKAFLVRGLILAKYAALGKAAGALGMPTNDEFFSEGRRRQDFEGGYLDYAAGDAEAAVHERDRKPAVSALPAVVTAGSRVRLTVSGFAAGERVRVSVSGQTDFEVTALTGAYSWEAWVPGNAAAALVLVRATDAQGAKAAEGSYRIRTIAETRYQLAKLLGDAQTGAPGALLPKPLRISLRDESGSPVSGAQVRFAASPGAQVVPATAVTGDNGEAEANLRLPAWEGAALATAEALRQVATFSALAGRSTLTSFSGFKQTGDALLGQGPGTLAEKGALLAAVASILRYHQNRNELGAPYGPADPAALNRFLASHCVFDAPGAQICDGFLTAPASAEQIVNLWRVAEFVGGSLAVFVEKPGLDTIRDLLTQGVPALLGLSLTAGEAPTGSHFVVAVGVGADGGVLIHDPNPTLARGSLGDYLVGFASGGQTWKGAVNSVIRLSPGAPSPTGFLVVADTSFSVSSAGGACGRALEWPDIPAPAAKAPGTFRARYCDGAQAPYQLEVLSPNPYQLTVTDLAGGGSRFEITGAGAAAYKLTRPGAQLAVAPQDVSFSARAVVNAASFTPAIAPGALVAIFGSGLARTGAQTAVEIGGLPCPVIGVSPFQLNVQVPLELIPGPQRLVVRSAYGAAEQTIEVQETAPAIFLLEGRRGAILNQDGKLNGPATPALRGQALVIYATGLGKVSPAGGGLWLVVQPVTVLVQGLELPAAFAGLAPGFPGLYQVNVILPAGLPPRLEAPLALQQGGAASNAVVVSIQ